MATDTRFLSRKIHELLGAAVKAYGPLTPPVDPFALAQLCGVRTIKHQHMVPEGVLQVVDDGFEISLQDNFANQTGTARRQRFTLAHELIHTFYYDRSARPPRVLQGSAEEDKLERLCNLGAGQLLVPTMLLKKEGEGRIFSQASEIVDLAQKFDVSAEVVVRRLDDIPDLLESDFAVVLVEFSDPLKPTIQAACKTQWLRAELPSPRPGTDFFQWIRPLWDRSKGDLPQTWTRSTGRGVIHARATIWHGRSRFLELNLADGNVGGASATKHSP
jgi:hypothetical protein